MTRRKPVPQMMVYEVGVIDNETSEVILRCTHEAARKAAQYLYRYVSLVDDGEMPTTETKEEKP